jgi:hypothetical protein
MSYLGIMLPLLRFLYVGLIIADGSSIGRRRHPDAAYEALSESLARAR